MRSIRLKCFSSAFAAVGARAQLWAAVGGIYLAAGLSLHFSILVHVCSRSASLWLQSRLRPPDPCSRSTETGKCAIRHGRQWATRQHRALGAHSQWVLLSGGIAGIAFVAAVVADDVVAAVDVVVVASCAGAGAAFEAAPVRNSECGRMGSKHNSLPHGHQINRPPIALPAIACAAAAVAAAAAVSE